MILANHHPQPPLEALFRECYYIHIGDEKGQKQIPVIDDCCYDFVFFKEAKGVFYYGQNHHAVPIFNKVFTIHDVTPPYRIEAVDTLTFFTIKLQPWANGSFFSVLKSSGVVDMGESHAELIPFHEQVFKIEKVSDKFKLAEGFIEGKMLQMTPSMILVREICESIYSAKGKLTVNQLSHQFERSRQYLGKVFKQEVMYSLKQFIITVRILDLIKFKQRNPDISLTELSYDYGYFDQPHFINDFKKVCGVAPQQFFNNLPEFLMRHR